MGNGCYAESAPLAWHWAHVSDGRTGMTLKQVCAQVRKLPRHQLWRWAQAGDLPGDGTTIDKDDMALLVDANRARQGFGFSHYDPRLPANAEALTHANTNGFTVNLSADNLAEADEFVALGIAPVVVVLPIGTTKPLRTPAGNFVAVCPATVRDDMQCSNCGICANASRKAVIGFPAHGSGAKKAQAIFFQSKKVNHELVQDDHQTPRRHEDVLASISD